MRTRITGAGAASGAGQKIVATGAAAAAAGLAISGAVLAASGQAGASPTVTEHFQEAVASPAAHRAGVIAYGAFTAAGTDQENRDGTNTFRFPGGSFLVTPKFSVASQHLDKATCVLTQTLRVTYTISHGTGAYAGIRGSGHGTLAQLEILARNAHGACSARKTPRAQQVIGHAQGPVTLR